MKVFFVNDKKHDYLSESLFHGLRNLLGNDCIDLPRYDQMYEDTVDQERERLRGFGFTLYGLLKDSPELAHRRKQPLVDIVKDGDIIIFNDIINQFYLFKEIKRTGKRIHYAILDGSDHNNLILFEKISKTLKEAPLLFFSNFTPALYFKREFTDEKAFFRNSILRALKIFSKNDLLSRVRPISFSIPLEKVHNVSLLDKVKEFCGHIVDEEVEAKLGNTSRVNYPFTNESVYYKDLQISKFGITTKRAGWDCLRHYEMAANGCIMCFKDLESKPQRCAPYDLVNGVNCISYKNSADLVKKTKEVSSDDYISLLKRNYEWIKNNTTIARASQFISHFDGANNEYSGG